LRCVCCDGGHDPQRIGLILGQLVPVGEVVGRAVADQDVAVVALADQQLEGKLDRKPGMGAQELGESLGLPRRTSFVSSSATPASAASPLWSITA